MNEDDRDRTRTRPEPSNHEQSLRQAFAALGLYTLISIGIGLVMSAWVPSPLIMVLIDWLAVVMGALAGTAIGVWIRVVKARQRRMSASGR